MKVQQGFIATHIREILRWTDDGHLRESRNRIDKALAADKRNDTMCLLGCDYELLAELSMHKGDRRDVQENLEKAITSFRNCGAQGHLKGAERKLTAMNESR